MKKIISVLLVIILLFCFTRWTQGTMTSEEFEAMLNSFNKSEDYVLLTHFELVVKGQHYDRSDIKYNEKDTDILFLDQDGFYSYTFNESDLHVEFLYTTYSFEATLLGEATVPQKIINAFFGDNCFWFRIDDPTTDEFKQIYYCWNIEDKTEKIVDDVDDSYEYSYDNNRTKDYKFDSPQNSLKTIFFNRPMEIVDNHTGTKKIIDKSVLQTFEEGRKLHEANPSMLFSADQIYVIDDDIYFVAAFGVGSSFEDPHYHYHYIAKWNFNTEECTFVTWIRFDDYQEWIDDMIILDDTNAYHSDI